MRTGFPRSCRLIPAFPPIRSAPPPAPQRPWHPAAVPPARRRPSARDEESASHASSPPHPTHTGPVPPALGLRTDCRPVAPRPESRRPSTARTQPRCPATWGGRACAPVACRLVALASRPASWLPDAAVARNRYRSPCSSDPYPIPSVAAGLITARSPRNSRAGRTATRARLNPSSEESASDLAARAWVLYQPSEPLIHTRPLTVIAGPVGVDGPPASRARLGLVTNQVRSRP